MKRKDLWLFLLKLAILTLLFGYVWFAYFQAAYPHVIKPIATAFFQLVGVRRWLLTLVLEHFTNIVPYLALVLATPGLIVNRKKTLIALFGGLAIIVAVHLLLSWAVYELQVRYQLSETFYKFVVPMYLFNDALPLVLWLSFYPGVPGKLFGLKVFERQEDRD